MSITARVRLFIKEAMVYYRELIFSGHNQNEIGGGKKSWQKVQIPRTAHAVSSGDFLLRSRGPARGGIIRRKVCLSGALPPFSMERRIYLERPRSKGDSEMKCS